MMTLFGSFVAPSVPHVTIYRDHQDAQRFYLIPSRPGIARDVRTTAPLFSFTLFSRNTTIAYASQKEGELVENQLGALNLTTSLAASDDELKLINQYLVELLKSEQSQPSAYNRLLERNPVGTEPTIGYSSQWLSGSVRLDILEGLGSTFKRNSISNAHPTLSGENTAALWATFGTEGANLLYKLFAGKEHLPANAPETEIQPTLASIYYELEGYAHVPAIRVIIKTEPAKLYRRLQERCRAELVRIDPPPAASISPRVDRSLAVPTIMPRDRFESIVREIQQKSPDLLTINWEDWGIPPGETKVDDIKDKLQQMVMENVVNQITDRFCKQFEVQQKDGMERQVEFIQYPEGYIPPPIEFRLAYSQNTRFKIYPQSSLIACLTESERKELVRIVDVGSPLLQVMEVPVYTNADFDGDRIANITVNMKYRQFDTLTNTWIEQSADPPFVFRTGKEVFTFRTRLARNTQGQLIDKYDATAKVNYIGTASSPPQIELPGITDRALTFSYDRLGYIKVHVTAGQVDWTQIAGVTINFEYPPTAGRESDGEGQVSLSAAQPQGNWSCSKRGNTSNTYKYTVSYHYKPPRQPDRDPPPANFTEAESLIINDNLVGRISKTFSVVMDPQSVELVTVKVRYRSSAKAPYEQEQKEFTSSGSWEYTRILDSDDLTTIEYSYDIVYSQDQVIESSPQWCPVADEDVPPPIKAKRYKLTIRADGDGLDWSKWRKATVSLNYKDSAHDYEVDLSPDPIDEETKFQTITINAFSPQMREYGYRVKLLPKPGSGETTREIPKEPEQFAKSSEPDLDLQSVLEEANAANR